MFFWKRKLEGIGISLVKDRLFALVRGCGVNTRPYGEVSAVLDQFKSLGIKCWPISVASGEIVGRDPDCAGTLYGHLCQQPELADQLKEKFAARRLSKRKRSAPARLHEVPKTDSTEGQDSASAESEPQKESASSKPSEPPRKRRREKYSKVANDENETASGDDIPRLAKRSRPVIQLKNGNAVGPAPGQPSSNAKYIRKVKVCQTWKASAPRSAEILIFFPVVGLECAFPT